MKNKILKKRLLHNRQHIIVINPIVVNYIVVDRSFNQIITQAGPDPHLNHWSNKTIHTLYVVLSLDLTCSSQFSFVHSCFQVVPSFRSYDVSCKNTSTMFDDVHSNKIITRKDTKEKNN